MNIKKISINVLLLIVFITVMFALALPFFAQVQFNAGKKLEENKQWEKAEEAYIRAMTMAPYSSFYWISYGDFLWEWVDQENIESAWEDIEPAYAWAVELNPECAQCWIKLGQVQHADNRIEEAIVSFRKALEVDPEGTDTDFWMKEYNIEK